MYKYLTYTQTAYFNVSTAPERKQLEVTLVVYAPISIHCALEMNKPDVITGAFPSNRHEIDINQQIKKAKRTLLPRHTRPKINRVNSNDLG